MRWSGSPARPDAGRLPKGILTAGLLVLLTGSLVDPERALPSLLLGAFLLLTLGLGGLFFLALEQATGASWCASIRRVPEAMAATLSASAAVFALALALNLSLYPWTHEMHGGADSPFWFKEAWLTPTFFVARAVVYLGVWVFFANRLLRSLRGLDEGWSEAARRSSVRLSAAFLVAFGLTFCLAAFDWIMSFEPHWYSTIFGVYNFAGLMLAALAMIAILAVRKDREGPLRGALTAEHLHDLGKLMFAFSSFWMYIWFTQYMLIWYTNIPEETSYFLHRLSGAWAPVFLANLALNWAGPFVVLLSVRSKRDPRILVKVCWVLLAGRCIDLYLMILPVFEGETPMFPVWSLAAAAAAFAAFLLLYERGFAEAAPVPTADPRVAAALHYHN